jgi:hypothetical protein
MSKKKMRWTSICLSKQWQKATLKNPNVQTIELFSNGNRKIVFDKRLRKELSVESLSIDCLFTFAIKTMHNI